MSKTAISNTLVSSDSTRRMTFAAKAVFADGRYFVHDDTGIVVAELKCLPEGDDLLRSAVPGTGEPVFVVYCPSHVTVIGGTR